ncbi:MAG: cyclic nucleotide-binding domain-containing protein [Pseudomonadota bacterium]
MELTLNSAFSIGGLIGQLAYALLVASMLLRNLQSLRLMVIASACVACVYSFVWQYDPVTLFWHVTLILVNVLQIAREWLINRRARFSAEEQKFVQDRLYTLAPGEARQLLNMGVWADGAIGTRLTTQGKPVDNLVYLVDGEVDIQFDGGTVGACLPGNYVGEMSVLNGGPASATAIVSEPSRYWMISAEQLRQLHSTAPSIAAALELGIAKDLRHKIMAANSSYVSAEPGM